MLTQNLFTNRDELFEKTAQRCQQLLESGLSKNGVASFVVPGGSTPAPVFERLSNQPLDWNNIQVSASDERWLKPTHEHSNQRLIENFLLVNNAKNAKLLTLKNAHSSAISGEDECNQTMQQFNRPIDVVMLGMGPDGHFASLFPGTNQIKQALNLESTKLYMAIDATGSEIAGNYPERMSMTLVALLNSKAIILLFTGKEKLEVLHKALGEGLSSNLPVSALLNQTKTPVELYWAP